MVMAVASLVAVVKQTGIVQAAACAPSADYGSVTSTLSLPSAGTYKILSRMKASSADTNANSYLLEIDGNTCMTIGDNTSISGSQWTWVDYQGGNTASKATHNFASGGNHTIKLIGREPGVRLDRLIFTADMNCVPTGYGDNCANPPDTTVPVVTVSSPASSATISGTATVNAAATDDTGVIKVEFFVDGQLISTDTSAPYSASLVTTTLNNGTHNLTAKAYDAAGNNATSASVSVNVQNGSPTPPPPPPAPAPTPTPPPPAPSPTPPPPAPTFKAADINQDGKVNIFDFSLLVAKYGQTGTSTSLGRADINQDGKVNIFDFSLLVSQYGT
jgi:hypothetical protein